MPQYDLIVPSGEAVLVDRATGVRLRLSAESGPLRLGSVTLDFAVEPKGLNASSGQPGEAAGAQTAPLSVPTVSQDYGQTASDPTLAAFERMQRLPPGFGANPAEAFGEGPIPTPASHSPVRVLDAPLEGLTHAMNLKKRLQRWPGVAMTWSGRRNFCGKLRLIRSTSMI